MPQHYMERPLQLQTPNGATHEFRWRIGIPRVEGEDWEWYTKVQLTLDGVEVETMNIFDVDAVDSLLGAIWIGGVRLRGYQDAYRDVGFTLTWLGGDDLGIPRDLGWLTGAKDETVG